MLWCKLSNVLLVKIEVVRTKVSLHNVNCSQWKHELGETYIRYSHVTLDLNTHLLSWFNISCLSTRLQVFRIVLSGT